MKVLKPGHMYETQIYTAKEDNTIPDDCSIMNSTIIFMHRVGEGYPGNEGCPFDGTNLQEVIRITIDRMLYVNKQIPCDETKFCIVLARQQLYLLELRAARRRDEEEIFRKKIAEQHWNNIHGSDWAIEEIPACKTCGHIFCTKHD